MDIFSVNGLISHIQIDRGALFSPIGEKNFSFCHWEIAILLHGGVKLPERKVDLSEILLLLICLLALRGGPTF
jgi:hypothetical protein